MIHARPSTRLALGLLTALALTLFEAAAPALGQEPARETPRTSRTTIARQRGAAAAATAARGSQGWWGGTVAMLVILGGAGAVCIAARRQAEAADGARLKVVGRVGLPPKHAVFLVKAGGRTLLIGTGPQGAPSLLGELDDDAAPVVPAARDDAGARSTRPIHAQHRIDVRLGDES